MIQIRSNVFETNSSSVHSLCISKEPYEIPINVVDFIPEYYGWDEGSALPTSYLITALYCNGMEDMIPRLKGILDKHGMHYVIHQPEKNSYGWCGHCDIDHSNDLIGFLNDIMNDEDKLLRFLFSKDSIVYTGNDNDCDADSMCYAGEAFKWRFNSKTKEWEDLPNPNYDPEHFEYYVKGN